MKNIKSGTPHIPNVYIGSIERNWINLNCVTLAIKIWILYTDSMLSKSIELTAMALMVIFKYMRTICNIITPTRGEQNFEFNVISNRVSKALSWILSIQCTMYTHIKCHCCTNRSSYISIALHHYSPSNSRLYNYSIWQITHGQKTLLRIIY